MQQNIDEKKMIKFSWERCFKFGLNPAHFEKSNILGEKEIKKLLKENTELAATAIPIIKKMSPILTQPRHIASLADRNGTIIYTLGDSSFEKVTKNLQMQVGANWLEKKRGTNAIGVAILEKNPVRVHGDQHFFINARFLSCAASPIFSWDGKMIGVINISGDKKIFHHYNFVLAQMIAEAVHNQLKLKHIEKEKNAAIHEIDFITNKLMNVPYFHLDERKKIIRSNQAAKKLLGNEIKGKEIKDNKNFLIKPLSQVKELGFIAIENKQNPNKRSGLYTFHDIKGSCPSIKRVKQVAERVAETDIPVLVIGETGTGKELCAQSIHSASLRANQPFIAINCSSIPESLIESELFGYIEGAFTGAASKGRKGMFEAAHNGTIFLDEIGDMSLRAQASLLRALQEKEITPVGSTTGVRVNVRVVAATNKNLLQEIEEGRFRADLYYRLKGIQITLPPLRTRNDILELAEHILMTGDFPFKKLTKEAESKLLLHDWPGNMRELMSVLFEAAVLSEGNTIDSEDLQIEKFNDNVHLHSLTPLKDAEKETIKRYLRIANGNMSMAAELLDISRTTLYRKMNEYQINLS